MKLIEARQRFARMVPRLLDKAHELGYEVSIGDCLRPGSATYGHPNSLHKLGLAIDLNLYLDGVYLKESGDHRQLGEWWESIGGAWGGRFNDGNHYSLAFNGMR